MSARFAACLAAAMATTTSSARAGAADGLALEEVVDAALVGNIGVKLAVVDMDAARAAWLAQAEPFDATVDVTGQSDRLFLFPPESGRSSAVPPAVAAYALRFAATASKLFRNGISISPTISTSQTRFVSDPHEDLAAGSVQIGVNVPLLRDRGGTVSAAPERAAGASYAAAALDARQARARGVLLGAIAYWQYRAATDRLAVTIASEARAERTANEIAQLSRADERTRADLNEARGHLSSRRAQRITAEAQVTAAWSDLAVVVGFARAPAAAPAAATEFPATGTTLSGESLSVLIEQAVAQRPDLASARKRAQAAAETLRAAEDELRPQLDLRLAAGYTSQLYEGPAHLFDPLVREIPGVEAGVQIHLQLPLERNGVRGRVAERSAAYQRERLIGADLERQIRIRVAGAFQAATVSRLALIESEAAVRLLEQTVDDEKAKFRVGASTLLAVIQSEEALTSAFLTRIDGQVAFALALANLRFETGSLVLPASRERAVRPTAAARMVSLLRVFP
jgi:outer membrane protein